MPATQVLTEEMGGELGQEIAKLTGAKFFCDHPKCKKMQTINEFRGYLHSGGLSDKANNKWWLFFHCECGYDYAGWKLENMILKSQRR
jgi:hypothetical protein